MKKTIITLFIAASTSSSFAYLTTYEASTNTLSEGQASVSATSSDLTDIVTSTTTDFSLGTDIWSPESAGTVSNFSFTNADGTTHTFAGGTGTTITAVHFFGLDNSFTIDAGGVGFSLVSGWDSTLSATGLVSNVGSVNAVGLTSGTAITGANGNFDQGHGTIVFDSAVSSFTLTENSGAADTVTLQFSTAIPEPSSTALLGLGGLAFILRRRR